MPLYASTSFEFSQNVNKRKVCTVFFSFLSLLPLSDWFCTDTSQPAFSMVAPVCFSFLHDEAFLSAPLKLSNCYDTRYRMSHSEKTQLRVSINML